MSKLSLFDPFSRDTIECPYQFYAALRGEAPVYRLPGAGYFVVSRYRDIRQVVMHPDLFSSNLAVALFDSVAPEVRDLRCQGRLPVDVLATADPPAHTRQRRLVNRTFNAHRIAALEPAVRSLTEGLFEPFLRRGQAEWMSELAGPLPLNVIADVLGFPRSDVPQLKVWSDHGIAMLSGTSSKQGFLEHTRAILELEEYLRARFDREQARPGDGIIGDFVRATRGEGETLSLEEVIAILVQLLIAGNETTTSLIGSAVWLLLERAETLRALRDDPSLVPSFVEEVLRLESPFQGHFRVAVKDTELAGVDIPAGSRVMLLWASANRDESAFRAPGEIDLSRANLKEHLGFGEGIHYCVGAPLARLETRIALEHFLRLRNVRRAPAYRPSHVPSVFIRRLEILQVEFDLELDPS